MDGTPRLRSAFPATPQMNQRAPNGARPRPSRLSQPIPSVPPIKQQQQQQRSASPSNEPVIPEHIIDAPSQRFYAFTLWIAFWSWKFYDYFNLQESEEQSLWLFMKWAALDGVLLFGLPSLRIPWLEWSSSTMTLLFSAHAAVDAMMMFNIPLPIGAWIAALGRSIWGVYEMAVNEHRVNPRTVQFNDSLLLGRQIIHILPEGSAILNPEREAFCVGGERIEARLPILINATDPVLIHLVRIDLETHANETIQIAKSQIRTMQSEASRLLSYGEDADEPKTLYYHVRKPGLYYLSKVTDKSTLEVSRKRMAHTVVVPCPKAALVPSSSDRCRGELSNIELEATGTPPMKVKYRKAVNQVAQESTFESIQPEDFSSPLTRFQNAVAVPNRVDTIWAKPQTVKVPLSESLSVAGKWAYSISEVIDGFGNIVTYPDLEHDSQERNLAKSSHLRQVITVHDRPTISLQGCTPQRPLKVAKGTAASLPVQYGWSGRGALAEATYHIQLDFTPQNELSSTGEHKSQPQRRQAISRDAKQLPQIQEPGLYTVTGVATDFCQGEVLEPSSCLLQNPPEPQLSIKSEEISDRCAGSPVGLRVDLDLIGTPPFEVHYRMHRTSERHHTNEVERVNGLRGQIELTPKQAGEYEYDFVEITDAVYKNRPLKNMKLKQDVKPSASARFLQTQTGRIACIDESASFDVMLQGEGPFTLEYELVHAGKRENRVMTNVTDSQIRIQTARLRDGGDYTLALVSVTDRMGCREFLKDEAKIAVRHQKPKAGFGLVEGEMLLNTLESKSVQLPLRLAGESPWTVSYLDAQRRTHNIKLQSPNDRLTVQEKGTYELVSVNDAFCPGAVDETAKSFTVDWIPRPNVRIPETEYENQMTNGLIRRDVCEGDDDSAELLFQGYAPFHLHYTQHAKLEHGAVSPKNKELRSAINIATLRMDTVQAGLYEYRFNKVEDSNYEQGAQHPLSLILQQRVNPRPSVTFKDPGKTYSHCLGESDGDEVIPIILHGTPPFELDYEIKHYGSATAEPISVPVVPSNNHVLRIRRSSLHSGRSTISLRRVRDANGCSRLLDAATSPRVQITVHDAPTIIPLESRADFCVGDRLSYSLAGTAPFSVFYNFEGAARKAVVKEATFRRLAETPGTLVITGLQDAASPCRAATNLTAHLHALPSAKISRGREAAVDIPEGGEVEMLFEFGGVPPFEFTYTRSRNTERSAKKSKAEVLEVHHEVSNSHEMRIQAREEGTYEVAAIKDRFCGYMKPGVNLPQMEAPQPRQAKKLLMR